MLRWGNVVDLRRPCMHSVSREVGKWSKERVDMLPQNRTREAGLLRRMVGTRWTVFC